MDNTISCGIVEREAQEIVCGRYNVTDNLAVRALMTSLGAPLFEQDKFIFSSDHSPGSRISIVRRVGDKVQVDTAIWWLMLDPATMKPNSKYASFNTRSDKLYDTRSIGYRPYRESRCIIPASAFIEGAGDKKTYHKIHFPNLAIAFGGIYKEWVNKETGEVVLSASIITCPPIPQWQDIHPKSCPLILHENPALRQKWLDPSITDVRQFDQVLVAGMPYHHMVTPIGKVSQWNETGSGKLYPPTSA